MKVLITGATAGIGAACAERFAAEGCDLVLTGRRKEKLEALADQLHQNHQVEVLPLSFDVRDRAAVNENLGQLPEAWQSLDVLINNAGLALGKSAIQDGDPDDWDTMIDTNVKGLLYVSKAIMPMMIARKQGHIINIASLAGKEVYPGGNVYCASKFAVDAISKAQRIDLLPHKIKVTNLAPGLVETEFSIVRFKGDEDKAAKVYEDIEVLVGEDIADIAWYAASLPKHVCLNDIVVTCTAQANSYLVHRGT